MIIKNGKTISSVMKGSTVIDKIYKGTLIVYENFKNLIASGVPPLTLMKCKGVDLLGYKIEGNSIQDGTPTPETPIEVESVGEKTKNLFDKSKWTNTFGEVEIDGIKYLNVGENGLSYYTIPGESSTSYTLTFSICRNSDFEKITNLKAMTPEGTERHLAVVHLNTIPHVVVYGGEKIYFIGYGRQDICVNLSITQLEEGNTATDFEPYGYKIPVKVSGKNLFNIGTEEDWIECNLGGEVPSDYLFSIEGNKIIGKSHIYATAGVLSNKKIKNVSGEYTISSDTENADNYRYLIRYFDKDGNNITSNYADYNEHYKSIPYVTHWKYFQITIPQEVDSFGFGIVFFESDTSTNMVTYSNLQMVEGHVTTTDYEPYIEPVTTNIYLNEPLRKIEDYADYIDFENKKVIRNIYQQKLAIGTSTVNMSGVNWQRDGHTSFYLAAFSLDVNGINISTVVNHQLSNIFGSSDWEWSGMTFPGNYCICGHDSRIFYGVIENKYLEGITDDSTDAEKINAITTFLNNTDIDITYIMQTPIEETIELPNIPTLKGTTILEVDTNIQPSNMEVTYKGKGE